MAAHIVIHQAAIHPTIQHEGRHAWLRWFIDSRGVRYWLLAGGPGWGWEVLDDAGAQIIDGLITLDDVREWAMQ